MNASPLTLDLLEIISAKEAALQNTVLAAINARAYQLAGQAVCFELATESGDEALNIAVQFNGHNLRLGLSQGLVNALLTDEGVSLSEVNTEILELLARIKVIPKLPQGVQLKGLSLTSANDLEQVFAALPKQIVLRARTRSGELLNWEIAISALPQTSLGAFLRGFEFMVVETIPSPLLKAKVLMPIVAAKTSIAAEQIRDIAVGDVILFG